jgi:two-component system sensor histidine kinase TctE
LVLWLAVPLMLLALCGALVHYVNNVTPSVMNSDRRLKDVTNTLMAHVQFLNGRWSLDARTEGQPALPLANGVVYAVKDSDGHSLLGDARLPTVRLNSETSQLFAMSQFDRRYVRTLTTRFDTPTGVVIITVADVRPATEPVARLGLMSTLLWDFVQLDITLVLVWVGIQLGLRPVKRLRAEIAERSPLDLRPIDESSVPREIAPVAITLNRLFHMLRTSVQSQQQFIANAAHQLRTPITGMQAQLDLLVAEAAAAPVKHRLTTLQEGVRQLAHSANQLLTLARVDPMVNFTAKNQKVELHNIVGDVVARFFDRALQLNIDLGVEARVASILADPALIDDLASNLVDNALKYTPAGGRVTVSTGEQNGKPYLAVEDTGRGIPESERQRVRQRFYRMPNSPGHGSGLGLAIVDDIAKLYRASFHLDAGANGLGTKATLNFP